MDSTDKYNSLRLISNFRKRTKAEALPNTPINDSLVEPSTFDIQPNLIKRIYFNGVCPWESTEEAHLFYTIPFDKSLADPISRFLFPHGCRHGKLLFKSPSDFINSIMSIPYEKDLEFMTLYFPTIEDGPFFHCCKFVGTPFSIPTISHELNIEDIFSLIQNNAMPICDMAICVQSMYKDATMFHDFIKWYLECERIGKLAITPFLELFMESKSLTSQSINSLFGPDADKVWPNIHRTKILAFLPCIGFTLLPTIGEEFVIDYEPFPPFKWTRKAGIEGDDKFIANCIQFLTTIYKPSIFVHILSALITENNFLVYSESQRLICNTVIALHGMLLPLNWVSTSISLLPDGLEDLLESPAPFIVGVDKKLKKLPPNTVILNIDKKTADIPTSIVKMPQYNEMVERLKPLFKEQKIEEIMGYTSQAIKELIGPIRPSIMTDISDKDHPGSRFVKELFLKNFPVASRKFVDTMTTTQMIQFYIELECRNKSAAFLNEIRQFKHNHKKH